MNALGLERLPRGDLTKAGQAQYRIAAMLNQLDDHAGPGVRGDLQNKQVGLRLAIASNLDEAVE